MSFTAAGAADGPDDVDSLRTEGYRQHHGADVQSESVMKAVDEMKELLMVIFPRE